MTPQQIEALKLALEALKLNNKEWTSLADSGDAGYWKAEDQDHYKQTEEAITALEEALAEHAMSEVQRLGQEIEQKPVAWEVGVVDGVVTRRLAPPQRPWVGLTDEQANEYNYLGPDMYWVAQEIAAILKEQNT
jgi:hypothetical protein